MATGEIEATRWGYRDLLERRAADILQPDATVAGGVTEWKKIAHMAAGWDIPIAPHWMANIHVHLLATVPNGLTVEFFVLEEDVFNFERMVREPLQPVNGMIQVPQRPGHGVELDAEAIRRYRIE